MADNLAQKSADNLVCQICDYKCCKQSDFKRHKRTQKHLRLTNADAWLTEKAQNALKNNDLFECECGNIYKHRQSLFKHKKYCSELYKKPVTENNISTTEILTPTKKKNETKTN